MASTPLEQLRLVAVMRFALPDEAQEEDAELAARIDAGDWTGVCNEDGTSYQP
ncbi:hypothetical protein [Streptomyces clavuligerus]|nr:hypothetical protein [Streptomyces clavuligerus]